MKVGVKHICPQCGSSNTQCLGHGGYKQGSNGFGEIYKCYL